MSNVARELVLVSAVAVLSVAFTVQIQRGEPLPAPPAMMTVIAAAPPPSDVRSRSMSADARLSALDIVVQELRLETGRRAFTEKLGHIVTALGTIPDGAPGDVSAGDIQRLRELVDETVEAIERRLEAQLDDQEDQQRLAGTIYELRRRMENINVWFRHDARRR